MKKIIGGAAVTLAVLTMSAGFVFAKNSTKTTNDVADLPKSISCFNKELKGTGKLDIINPEKNGIKGEFKRDFNSGFKGKKMDGMMKGKGDGCLIKAANLSEEAKALQTEIQVLLKDMKKATLTIREEMNKLSSEYKASYRDKILTVEQKSVLRDQFEADLQILRDKLDSTSKPYMDQIAEKQKAFFAEVKASLPLEAQTLINEMDQLRTDMDKATADLRTEIDTKREECKTKISDINLSKDEKKVIITSYKTEISTLWSKLRETSKPFEEQIRTKKKQLREILKPIQSSIESTDTTTKTGSEI